MQLEQCTPENLRAQILEIREDWSTEDLVNELHKFGELYNDLALLDENGDMILSVLSEDSEWFYLQILEFLFRQEELGMDDDWVYEGEEYIKAMGQLNLNVLRWLINSSGLLSIDTRTICNEKMRSIRETLVIHLLFLLEDRDLEDEDDDDDDDDDDGGGDWENAGADTPSGGVSLLPSSSPPQDCPDILLTSPQ